VRGLCEVLRASRRKSAFFYNWEELRDLSRPASLCRSFFASLADYGDEEANRQVMEQALPFIRSGIADFTFVYLGWTDHAGHNYGWMGPEYMRSVRESMAAVDEIRRILSEDDLLVVTADHGGHDRVHGTERPEDMTIPLFFCNPAFGEKRLESASIIDIAPTITAYLGLEADPDWEGKNLLQ
jgi:phosphopentomutase